jgi:hypothetical protein
VAVVVVVEHESRSETNICNPLPRVECDSDFSGQCGAAGGLEPRLQVDPEVQASCVSAEINVVGPDLGATARDLSAAFEAACLGRRELEKGTSFTNSVLDCYCFHHWTQPPVSL